MKVNQTGLDQVQSADRKPPAEVEASGQARPSRANPAVTDRVEWSGTAREAARRLQELPEVRADRVAAIARQVRQGEYRVPAEEVARKLLAFFRQDER